MTRDELVSKIKKDLSNKILNWNEKSPKRIYLQVDPKDIFSVAKYFHQDIKARFNIASGVDTPNAFEILYHFTPDEFDVIFSIRVMIPDKKNPSIDSITPLLKGAEWIEREMWELLGINFKGHPNLKRLLLADDWPQGQYPLRRDYKINK